MPEDREAYILKIYRRLNVLVDLSLDQADDLAFKNDRDKKQKKNKDQKTYTCVL